MMNKGHGLTAASAAPPLGAVRIGAVFLLSMLGLGELMAHGNTPPSLTGVAVPVTPGLLDGNTPIVVDKTAAIQLGKALFWDTDVGSDGMACASCHFHAGADGRFRNQIAPGYPNKTIASSRSFAAMPSGDGGPNYTLRQSDFPLHQLSDPTDKASTLLFDSDDLIGSAGTFLANFKGQGLRTIDPDDCKARPDGIFHQGDLNTRRVQARQAPSVINAAYNFRNFWDGRANNIFNGVSPFGVRDVNAGIWVMKAGGRVSKQLLRLENASLASQAMAPPVNSVEMSCRQRGFADIGRRMLARRPLARQKVHAQDSVLADLRHGSGKGLKTSYAHLIKSAFARRYWAGKSDFGLPKERGAAPYTQMEANFSLFFGLAIQLYEETLISDQTPFDTPRLNGYPQMPKGLNGRQRRGLKVFLNSHCVECHRGPTLSSAAHPLIVTPAASFSSLRLVNRKTINGDFHGEGVAKALLDEGFFNTSVAPAERDMGVGGKDPFGNPLSFSKQYVKELLTGKPLIDPVIVNSCDMDSPFALDFAARQLRKDPYITGNCGDDPIFADLYNKIPKVKVLRAELKKPDAGRMKMAVNGAFKVPSLRNVELTGPYMHNGSLLTLEQVVDFYFRGGNFNNPAHFATLVFPQPISAGDKADLVAFLKSLTDERVRWERAPFDHPELVVPHGHRERPNPQQPLEAKDLFLRLPAVGKRGRSAALGPLKPFQDYLQP